jgi:3-hydroxybutyryl-CoA dehydrogenase
MGPGIAQAFSAGGYQVWLVDVKEDILHNAVKQIRDSLSLLQKENILNSKRCEAIISRIHTTLDLRLAVEDAEYVTEAVSEDLRTKRKTFSLLEASAPRDAILASNTSGLSLTKISSEMRTADRTIGTNWWNPPQIMPLVEIMSGKNTSPQVLERTRSILSKIGKRPITILKPVSGFVGNRLQVALLREALSLLERGVASIEDIDTAVRFGPGFRYPVLGPFSVCDFGGLDVFYHLSLELFNDLDNSSTAPEIMRNLVEKGRLGLKSGGGFYDYKNQQGALVKDRDRKLLAISRALSSPE